MNHDVRVSIPILYQTSNYRCASLEVVVLLVLSGALRYSFGIGFATPSFKIALPCGASCKF